MTGKDHQMNAIKRECQAVISIAVFTVLVLAWSALASEKNPVTRPYVTHLTITAEVIMLGEAEWYVDDQNRLIVGIWALTGIGVATHAGKYTDEGYGVAYVDLNDGRMYGLGSGCATTVRGEQLTWESWEPLDGSRQVTVTFTGGTGRFESVSGQFKFIYPEPTEPGGWTAKITGVGTITY
jgi:hypothetical protein